jgi:hypothetical protein
VRDRLRVKVEAMLVEFAADDLKKFGSVHSGNLDYRVLAASFEPLSLNVFHC